MAARVNMVLGSIRGKTIPEFFRSLEDAATLGYTPVVGSMVVSAGNISQSVQKAPNGEQSSLFSDLISTMK